MTTHVYVYYRAAGFSFGDLRAMDAQLRKLAGKSDIGSGCDLRTGVRDLEFSFRDPFVAAAFERKVERLKGIKMVMSALTEPFPRRKRHPNCKLRR